MAKLGEKELMNGLKQGAIAGIGISVLTVVAPKLPAVGGQLMKLGEYNPEIAGVALSVSAVVYAAVSLIGVNWALDAMKK